MTTVHTAHGQGEIIDSNTVRGRTTYKVAGDGFSVWLDETEVNKRTATGPDAMWDLHHRDWQDEQPRGGAEVDEPGPPLPHKDISPYDRHIYEASASFDFEPTDHVWDNHTTLPYNWQPQFPVDMFRAEQTISPDHQIDLKERMHDSDSRTGEDREPTHTYPGPNPDLFAKKGSFLGHTPDHKIPEYLEHLRGKVQNQNISWGELSDLQGLASAGYIHPDDMELHEAAGTPEEDFNRGQDRDPDRDPFDPREFGANKQAWTFHDQDEESEPDRWEHLNEHAHGIEHAAAGLRPEQEDWDAVRNHQEDMRHYGPELEGIDDSHYMIPPEHRAPEGEPSWQDHVQAEGEHQDHLNFGPHQPEHPDHLGSYRPAGLSSKYADIHESVDHFNDPVQRFRDDPQTAIQRHAYIDISAGLDHETGEWMDLVQADKQIRTAAWNDVRKKAMRLKREGAVHVKDMSQDHIYANVDGDNGNYEVMILKGSSYGGMKNKPGGQAIADWRCSCEWGKHAFTRKLTYVGRLCFLPGTKVVMADSTLKPIEEIVEGDLVRSHTGEARKVTATILNHHDDLVYGVHPRGHETVWATGNHPFYVRPHTDIKCQDCWDNNRQRSYCTEGTTLWKSTHEQGFNPQWVEAENLTTDYWLSKTAPKIAERTVTFDLVEFCEHYRQDEQGRIVRGVVRQTQVGTPLQYRGTPVNRYIKLDEDLAYLFGLYLGDGSHPRAGTVGFHFGLDEQYLVDEVTRIAGEKFGLTPQVHVQRGGRNIIDVFLTSAIVTEFFHRYVGTGHAVKKLAPEVLEAPASVLAHVLRGWIDSDDACSVNRNLVFQMEQIALRNSISCSVTTTPARSQGNVLVGYNTKDIYRLNCSPERDQKSQFFTNFVEGDTAWVRVQNIEQKYYHGPVFNLSVEGEESYQVNGINTHNCSHGYASYLTMQGEYAKEPKHPFRKRNGSVDDFKKWVKDENGDHIDTDAADSYLSTLETPATKEEAEKVYDYVQDHHTERPERDYDQDGYTNDPDEAYKTAADVLNHQPGKLTPHLYVVPEGEEQHFEDLGDDRKTTGPDQIMARVAKGEDAISEHHPDFAWHNKGQDDFPEEGIVHFSSLIYTADEDLINKLRDLSDDQPSEHFHDMQDHNREVSEVVEELHDRGYAAAPLVAMKRQAMWKTADDRLPGERDEDKGFSGLSPFDFSDGADSHSGPVSSGGGGDVSGLSKTLPFGPAGQGSGAGGGGSFLPQLTHDLGQAKPGAPSATPAATAGGGGFTPVAPGAHPTDQFSSSGISGGGYKEPNAGKPGYSQSGQSSIYDPNGAGPAAPAAKPTPAVAPPAAAVAPPAAVAAPAPAAGATHMTHPGGAAPGPAAGGISMAPGNSPNVPAHTSGTHGQPLTLTRDMGNYGPNNPYKGAQRFAERYFFADDDDPGPGNNKTKPGSSGLPPVTPSAGGPPPNGAVGKGGEDHYKVISPGGAQVNQPRSDAMLPAAPASGVVAPRAPGVAGGQGPGLAGQVGGGPAGGGVGDVMSRLGPILNQIPGIGGALGGVMGMIPKGGSAQHFAAQYMHGAGSPTPMSNPAPAGKGKPSANQAAPATPSAPTAKPTAASAITGQIPNLLSGSGGGMGLASPTVGGMSQGLGGITKTLSAQHFARQYMAGGDFLTKGGPNWMDYPFAGSGPDRQDFSGTSEDYVEEHERPNRQETWRTDNEGDIIKYTQTQPKQAALFAARYFYADGDIAGSGDAGYGAGGATHPGGGDTYGGGIVHAPSSGSGGQDFATVGTQGGSTPTMGTMTNTAAISESSRQFWADAFHPGQSGYFNPTNRPFQNDDSAQPKKVPPGKGKPKTPGAPAPAGGPVEAPVPPGGALAEAAEAVPALATVASYGGDDSDVVRRFHAAGAGALGSPTGASNGAYSDDAIATNARRMLRTAGRHFTRAEERELEDEQHVLGARNLKDLDLTGTHYLDD